MSIQQSQASARLKASRFLKCLLYAFMLILVAFIWINSRFTLSLEEKFLRLCSVAKHQYRQSGKSSVAKQDGDAGFINAASSLQLIKQPLNGGNTAISDRLLIDSFLRQLNRYPNPERIIILDLDLNESSPADSLLSRTFPFIPNLFLSLPADTIHNPLYYSVPPSHIGSVRSHVTNNWFGFSGVLHKFSLLHGHQKSLPLVVLEQGRGARVKENLSFLWINGKPYTKTVIVDETIRSYQFMEDNGMGRAWKINYALKAMANKSIGFEKLIKMKYVAIGDFDRDIHRTSAGPTPGGLILMNVILSIENETNRITVGWFLFMLLGYASLLYYLIYFPTFPKGTRVKNFIKQCTGQIIGQALIYIPACMCLSAISYFLFDKLDGFVLISVLVGFFLFLRTCLSNIKKIRKSQGRMSFGEKMKKIFVHES